jgi:hypothetical protein
MKKVLLLSLFLTFLFQAQSQNAEVEIYSIQNNTIVKGTIEENSSDSLRVRVDSLHTMAFAKTELEGKELPVSKEVKKLRRRLIRDESIMHYRELPGTYQIEHGKIIIGKIMFVLVGIGIVGILVSGGIYIVGLATLRGLELLGCAIDALFVFMPSAMLGLVGTNWSIMDRLLRIQKIVNNRYYYRGEITY